MRLRLLKFEYKTKGAYICGNQRIYPTVKSSTSASLSDYRDWLAGHKTLLAANDVVWRRTA